MNLRVFVRLFKEYEYFSQVFEYEFWWLLFEYEEEYTQNCIRMYSNSNIEYVNPSRYSTSFSYHLNAGLLYKYQTLAMLCHVTHSSPAVHTYWCVSADINPDEGNYLINALTQFFNYLFFW